MGPSTARNKKIRRELSSKTSEGSKDTDTKVILGEQPCKNISAVT